MVIISYNLNPRDIIKEFNCMMNLDEAETEIGLLANYKVSISIHVVAFNYNCRLCRKKVIKEMLR